MPAMKTYRAERTERGVLVTVDGQPLDPRRDLRDLGAEAFEWGYEGTGPAQLALAILADMRGPAAALEHYRLFMETVVAELPPTGWSRTDDDFERRMGELVVVPMDLETLLKKVRGEI
jgi:hypothetical protein